MPDAVAAYEAAGRLVRMQGQFRGIAARVRAEQIRRIWAEADGRMSLSRLGEILGVSKARAAALLKSAGELAEGDPSVPEPQPVVAAIVTSDLGVLIGRRNDGKPPWTFIAGEIEPGESPEDAAVREVKEETGLLVRAAGIIGRRVHPKTQRTMIYMSAVPTHGTAVFVGDEDELAAVCWVNLEDADQLLPGMFEPVRAYLARILGK
jgi:8-oxo-dGTP pyrophosphatase MutT (NUDIX family)